MRRNYCHEGGAFFETHNHGDGFCRSLPFHVGLWERFSHTHALKYF